jgi:hypothetical protein
MALAGYDRQEAERLGRTFEEPFHRGDATTAGFHAEDAEGIAPDTDLAQGRRAIESFLRRRLNGRRTGMKQTSKCGRRSVRAPSAMC